MQVSWWQQYPPADAKPLSGGRHSVSCYRIVYCPASYFISPPVKKHNLDETSLGPDLTQRLPLGLCCDYELDFSLKSSPQPQKNHMKFQGYQQIHSSNNIETKPLFPSPRSNLTMVLSVLLSLLFLPKKNAKKIFRNHRH